MEQYSDNLVKAVVQGVVTSTATCFWVLNRGSERMYIRLPLVNQIVPAYVFAGVLGSLSSVGSDLLHTFIKKEIPISAKTQEQGSMILGALLGGSIFTAGMYLLDRNTIREYGLWNAMLVGGASDIIASFGTNLMFE